MTRTAGKWMGFGLLCGMGLTLSCGKELVSPAEIESPTCADDELLRTISSDTTLSADCFYRVENVIGVVGSARLTIEPGVTIELGLDAAIEIRDEASIVALGTDENPITFQGSVAEAGHWRSLNIQSPSADNELGYVDFLEGGSEETCCAIGREAAMVLVEDGGRVSIHDTHFELSGHNALAVESGGRLSLFEYNSFYENEGAPIRITANEVGSLDADTIYASDPEFPHGDNFIEISGVTVQDDAVWPETDLPYRSRSGLNLSATLTLSPGVQLEFDADEGLIVSETGSLIAEGSEDLRIVFSGPTTDAENWKGILMEENSVGNSLAYVDVYGGGSEEWCCVIGGAPAALIVRQRAQLTLTDSLIRNSLAIGLRVRGTARLEGFARNSFLDNRLAPIVLTASEVSLLDSASVYAQEGEDIYVSVLGNAVLTDGTWPALDVPYRFEDDNTSLEAAIKIDPGAHLTFASDSGLWVESTGSLNADGQNGVITFDGSTGLAGTWKGLGFASNSADNVLNAVVIDGAGSEDWCCEIGRAPSAILIEPSSQLTLTDSTVSRSSGWGVRARAGYAAFTESGNTYVGLASGDVSLLSN